MDRLPALFDANGSFGCTSTAHPDFRDAAALLAHLDRLGIERSLVWHSAAMKMNSAFAFRKLTEDSSDLPGAAERLIPAYAAQAGIYNDKKSLGFMKECMKTGGVRAFRVILTEFCFRLSELEPVIEEIEQYKPVLFFSLRDPLDPDQLLAFAGRFPLLPMVVMHGMWHNMNTIRDLMRRRSNIYADTSWMHSFGALESMAAEFGADRIIFSTGQKAHNGASITALANVRLEGAERELIAHGNLERLLGLGPVKDGYGGGIGDGAGVACGNTCTQVTGSTRPAGRNRLWHSLLAGDCKDLDILDAHGHVAGMTELLTDGRDEEIEALIGCMDRTGVKQIIVSGWQALAGDPVQGNRGLLETARPYAERISGYFVFNPFYGDELTPLFDEFFSHGFFVGFKLLCYYWRLSVRDPRFTPMWEYADRHCLPVLIHSWDAMYDAPGLLKDIVRKYRNVSFIIGHSGGEEHRDEAEELANGNPNVYLEFCGSFVSQVPWEDTLKRVDNSRVVFGSDSMDHDLSWELGRLLSLDVEDEVLHPILGDNMRKVLAKRR